MMNTAAVFSIPRYFLYGDQNVDVDVDFLHAEAISVRSGANAWMIRLHSHPDHVQILLVTQGGGWISMEEERHEVAAPSLIVIPSAIVHEISFHPDTNGEVITVANAFIGQLATDVERRELATVLRQPAVYRLESAGLVALFLEDFAQLREEFVWTAPYRGAVITARFLLIATRMARLAQRGSPLPTGQNYQIFSDYLDLIERSFRHHKTPGYYAAKLGVTGQRLNQTCRIRAGKTASVILSDRLIVEAKRYLLYSGLGVAEIGHNLGFDDPAYFSRFFSKRVGQPPASYRDTARKPLLDR